MNRPYFTLSAIFCAFAAAWIGLILIPYYQVGALEAVVDEETQQLLPPPPSGLAQQGARVYAAQGCAYCHTQQIKGEAQGADIARGWGSRRTVARDYRNQPTPFLGLMRIGPDLSNVGARYKEANELLWFLYNPRMHDSHATMPRYSFLFRIQQIKGQPSAQALKFDRTATYYDPPNLALDEEIIPTDDARALAAYLLSLNHNYPLPEAPLSQTQK